MFPDRPDLERLPVGAAGGSADYLNQWLQMYMNSEDFVCGRERELKSYQVSAQEIATLAGDCWMTESSTTGNEPLWLCEAIVRA